MKRGICLIIVSFFILILPAFAFAQAAAGGSESGKEATIEELYLQNVEIRIIKEQAVSEDREMKLLALRYLQEMVDEGRITGDDTVAIEVLDYLSSEGIGRITRENGLQVNNFPDVRRMACSILGQIGGEAAKDTLVDVLMSDNEPMVRSEAVYALGQIGLNENNEVSRAIAWIILQQDAVRPDNNFAFAALLALGKIAEKNNGIKDEEVYRAVLAIASGNYIRDVKYKAREILNELRNYK